MSRSAFAAAFKTYVGEAPAEHLMRRRVSLAKGLLREGASIKAVADQLGYGTASSLSRAFAATVGASPRAWLRHVQPGA